MSSDAQIHLTCSNGHKLRVKPELAGKRIRCPNKSCGEVVLVPSAKKTDVSKSVAEQAALLAGEESVSRSRKRKRSTSRGWGSWRVFRWGILVLVGATVLFALVILLTDLLLLMGFMRGRELWAASRVPGRVIIVDSSQRQLFSGAVFSGLAYFLAAAAGYVLCAFVPHPRRALAWLAASALCLVSALIIPYSVRDLEVTLVVRAILVTTVLILAFASWLLFLRFLSDVAAANKAHWLFTNLRSSQRWGLGTAVLFIATVLSATHIPWEDAPTPLPLFGLYATPLIFGLAVIGECFVFYSYIRTLLFSRRLEED